ncbi:MAG TPA: DUF6788 family protein [Candidatus Sulfotelmatobacter sp.]|nr:DUF6788 family protein [Candidatus Sulfotelmatobacter sp.]
MKHRSRSQSALARSYQQLQRRLGSIGYITQGSVVERRPPQQGSRYVWTRKLQAKTVTVALSKDQYEWMRQAVANQRELERIMRQMQRLSRRVLFKTLPDIRRHKPLNKKVLGLI